MALNYGVRQGNLIVCVFRKLQSTFLYNFVIYISTIKIEYFSPHRKAWILWHIEKELELEYNIFFQVLVSNFVSFLSFFMIFLDKIWNEYIFIWYVKSKDMILHMLNDGSNMMSIIQK